MRDEGFKEFVEDQLEELTALECRRMFGGFGLYSERVFFGIIASGQLYFKTDDTSRQRYLERSMQPFRPNPRQTLRTYYEVPVDILEDRDEMVTWAQEAVRSQSQAAGRRKGRVRQGNGRRGRGSSRPVRVKRRSG